MPVNLADYDSLDFGILKTLQLLWNSKPAEIRTIFVLFCTPVKPEYVWKIEMSIERITSMSVISEILIRTAQVDVYQIPNKEWLLNLT